MTHITLDFAGVKKERVTLMTPNGNFGDFEVAHWNGRRTINNMGKFEGQNLYVPYFYDLSMHGDGDYIYPDIDDPDEYDGIPLIAIAFSVTDQDRDQFPELQDIEQVHIRELDSGFVVEMSKEEVQEDIRHYEDIYNS